MSQASIQRVHFDDAPAIQIDAGGYRAVIAHSVGSNMVELSRPGDGLSFLRTPENGETLRQKSQRYGLPPLFPPNRIIDGKFATPYRRYELPLNSSDGAHFMHGILHKRPWQIHSAGILENGAAEVVFLMEMGQDGEMFSYFPHEFTYELAYTLSEKGLHQQVRITNQSGEPMPFGVGFHTALRVPFHEEGREEDYRLAISVAEQWEVTPLFVSTGKLLPLSESDRALRGEGIRPTGTPYANHFTGGPMERGGKPFYGAALTDTRRNISLVYEVDPKYGHWTVWNDDGLSGFVCPEPQTWANNAPNVDAPESLTGFQLLAPGQSWHAWTRMYAEFN
ncbi:aldose 1-epimerase [Paenibacillus doosanensis]|uniref:aldose 1-epimerase n=1 Tax=Paenibacillus doosanensis TaxID=1229154 RepID=UPI0021803116|nr:aldose 1-epimerase [Paenibacillus doosanensis]MCS7463703.1 aldose 1-epimerase [Paenibacillus doosanensis]